VKPAEFLARYFEERASAIIRCDDHDIARQAVAAAVRGGFGIVEFTLTVPRAYDLIREFSAAHANLVVGAGTVLERDQARRAVEAGARFLVSPVVEPEVIATARELGVTIMPGVQTATEALAAHRLGGQIQKLFPPPPGGPDFVRYLLGPLPFLRLVPTAGVDGDNVAEWIAAGVFAVGFVGTLFRAEDLRLGRYDAITERARTLLAATRKAERPRRAWSFE